MSEIEDQDNVDSELFKNVEKLREALELAVKAVS